MNRDDDHQHELEKMAEEILELSNLGSLARNVPRKKRTVDLTETEFATLDYLARAEPLTVGELQKHIRVLPAQMSRIIRALESKAGDPMIRCDINQQDKRRIDVRLSDTGRKAHEEFRRARLGLTLQILEHLSDRDRNEFMRILRHMRTLISDTLQVNA